MVLLLFFVWGQLRPATSGDTTTAIAFFLTFYHESRATGGKLQSRISNGTLIIILPPFEANLPMRCLTPVNIVLTLHFQRWMFLHQAYYGLHGKPMQTCLLRTPKTPSDAALQLPQRNQKQKVWRSHWDSCQGWWVGDDGVRVQCSSCLGQQRFARLIGAWQQPMVAGWLAGSVTGLLLAVSCWCLTCKSC